MSGANEIFQSEDQITELVNKAIRQAAANARSGTREVRSHCFEKQFAPTTKQ